MTSVDDHDDDEREERLGEIERAILRLAKRHRGPQDLARLIAGDDLEVELIAKALGYVAGLAVTIRQALRHYGRVSARVVAVTDGDAEA